MFARSEQGVIVLDFRAFFYAFKCKDENTPFVTDVMKYRVLFWNMEPKH